MRTMTREYNLYEASNQWARRPDDERFFTVKEGLEAARRHYAATGESRVPFNQLHVKPEGSEVLLVGPTGKMARFTYWGFNQYALKAGAPAAFLKTLPADLTANILNYKAAEKPDTSFTNILFHTNGGLVARCFVSDLYSRIWNHDVLARIDHAMQAAPGWRVPPARPVRPGQAGTRLATHADVLRDQGFGLSVKVGDPIAPAGVYVSDHDMFVLLINEDSRIDDGTDQGLSRGVIITNSEVGAATFRVQTFMLRHVCGNHILWGVSEVKSLSIRHIGRAADRWVARFEAEVTDYANQAAGPVEATIKKAKTIELEASKDKLLDKVFGMGILSKTQAEQAYALAERNEENPRSVWGYVQGVTRLSQQSPYMDERHKLDMTASKILKLAF